MTPVEEIKAKIDLTDFLRGYLDLKPAGRNFKGCCPFHKEKTPSLVVSPERQIWHCFGCNEGGDIFRFIMKYENLEFYEALKFLAEKAGVELKKVSPQDHNEFGIIYDLNRAAADFYKKNLNELDVPLAYLKSRGLTSDSVEKFELGFASVNYEDLILYLIKLGYESPDIARAGLASKTERGNYIDRFRGRIMFPLYNSFGKIIGFTGRILPQLDKGDMAKYMNSPETPIFSKSRLLYGLSQAKEGIRQHGEVLLVEGQMDVIMSHQDGVTNSVGTSGTALTDEQLQILKRFTNRLILNFDNDEAGKMAIERSIDLAYEKDFETKVLDFSEFKDQIGDLKDPADIVKAHPGVLTTLVPQSEHAMNFYLHRYPVSVSDIFEKKKNIRFILKKISIIQSAVEKDYWFKELEMLSGIRELELKEELNSLSAGTPPSPKTKETVISPPVASNIKLSKRDMSAKQLLLLALKYEGAKPIIESGKEYLPAEYLELYNLATNENEGDAVLRLRLDDLNLRSGLGDDLKNEDILKEAIALVKNLQIEYLSEKKGEIDKKIRNRESYYFTGDVSAVEEIGVLQQESNKIAEKIQEIKRT